MIIPVEHAQVNFVFTGTGLPNGAEVTLGINHETNASTQAVQAGLINDAWDDNIQPQLSSSCSHTLTVYKYGPNSTGPTVEVAGGGAGPLTSAAVPPNTSVLVTKVTGVGGRQGRGRMFIPGLPEGLVDQAGIVDPTTVLNIQAAVDAFFADLIAVDLVPVVLHSESSPVALPYVITEFVVSNRVATQRERLRR